MSYPFFFTLYLDIWSEVQNSNFLTSKKINVWKVIFHKHYTVHGFAVKWLYGIVWDLCTVVSLTSTDLHTPDTDWQAGEDTKSRGKLGNPRMVINGSRPPRRTNSLQWSSVELLLSMESTNRTWKIDMDSLRTRSIDLISE